MSLEDKFDKLAEDTHTFHGEVRGFMVNQTAYIGAVSAKLNNHLDDHTKDLKSQVSDERKGVRENMGLFVTAGLSILAIVLEGFTYLKGHK